MAAVVNAEQPLARISEFRYKAKDSRRFHKLMLALSDELKLYHSERMKLFKDWAGEPDAQGNQEIKPEHREDFLAAMSDLLGLPVELNAEPIPFAVIENEDVSPMELAMLGPFIQYAD